MRYVAAPLSLVPNCSLHNHTGIVAITFEAHRHAAAERRCRHPLASAANVEEDPLSLLMRTRPPWGQQYVALCFLQVLIGNFGGESGYPGIELT